MRTLVLFGVTVTAAVLLTACTGSADDDATPAPTSATTSSATSASASPSPTVTAFTSTCETALALIDVSRATGQPVQGRTEYVVGQPDPTIGRLAYLNCRYGLPTTTPAAGAAAPVPGVEIGVSLYDSADRASDRVAGTVEDYRESGSRAEDVDVAGTTGTVLVGGGPPTLVVARDAKTVAVSVSRTLSTGFQQLVALAELALEVD
ncbi:hypothetical protein ACXR2U_11800 [Jatrophihabitans sp. YIM 134969]